MKTEVIIKMHVDNAKQILDLITKLSNELYSGDDWKDRSTLEERVVSISAQVDIGKGIKRYEKRIKRAWQVLFFLVLLIINKTGGKNA